MTRLRAATIVLLLTALPAAGRADDQNTARAKAHFETGEGHFKLGRYRDAIQEFTAGYALMPLPRFLINLGQAHLQLGEYRDAAEMYREYLKRAPPNEPFRAQVIPLLEDAERAAAGQPAVAPAPLDRPLAPTVITPTAPSATVAPTDRGPAPATTTSRRWLWIIVPVAVVLAAAIVGLVLGLSPARLDCSPATLGCFDLR